MPTMSRFEAAFCRSALWRFWARRMVLPWALQGIHPEGRVLEIGAGSGAMAAELLGAYPGVTMTVTDFDPDMVAAAQRRLMPYAERSTVRQADATSLPFHHKTWRTPGPSTTRPNMQCGHRRWSGRGSIPGCSTR